MGQCSSKNLSWSDLRKRVLCGVRPLVKHHEQAEDIAQETLMRAWVGWNQGTIRNLGMAWMNQVSRRIVVDHRREQSRAPNMESQPSWGDGSCDPRRLVRRIRTCRGSFPLVPILGFLEDALESLPPELKPVLCARARGMSQREIASRLRLGLSAVRMRMARGRRILEREILRDLKKRGEL
jgi:RNA polymerase sigma-70 factor (ECF subfamily)